MAVDTKLSIGIVGCLGHSWSENVFSDITVVIGGQKFHCQRFHLSACSELFRVLLESNASLNFLTIKGIEPDIFDIILKSIYKGENRITTDNIMDLWYAVSQLEIRFLLDEIENFIILKISKDNYLKIFDLASDLKSNQVLAAVCQTFILNWEKFRQDQRFLTLSFEELQTIIQNVNTLSPDELVETILIWTNYEPSSAITTRTHNHTVPFSKQMEDEKKCVEITLKNLADLHISGGRKHDELTTRINRKELCGKLLKNVKLELISKNGLKKLLCDDVVMDCKEARDLVRQALTSSLESLDAATSGTVTENTQSKQHRAPEVATCILEVDEISETSLSKLPKIPEVATCIPEVDEMYPSALFFDGSHELIAYSFNSSKFYSVGLVSCDLIGVVDFFVLEKNLYAVFDQKYSSGRCCVRITGNTVSEPIFEYYPRHNRFITACGDFFYKFITDQKIVIVFRLNLKGEVWHKVGKINTKGEISSIFCFQDIILVVVSVDTQTSQFFYFDTTSRISRLISEENVEADALSAFYVGNKMYFLHGNGELFEVVREDSVTLVLREQLNDFKIDICGVVAHNSSIFIFCDFQNTPSLQRLTEVCSLGDIRYIHMFKVKNKCLYMDVPQSWLTVEL